MGADPVTSTFTAATSTLLPELLGGAGVALGIGAVLFGLARGWRWFRVDAGLDADGFGGGPLRGKS